MVPQDSSSSNGPTAVSDAFRVMQSGKKNVPLTSSIRRM